jgi:DNA polymerase III alpha subunit
LFSIAQNNLITNYLISKTKSIDIKPTKIKVNLSKKIKINEIEKPIKISDCLGISEANDLLIKKLGENYYKYPIFKHKSAIELIKLFTRKLPNKIVYYMRLEKELNLIISKNFLKVFLQVMEILEFTKDYDPKLKNIPHIIRGSAGSSLCCYLLGITDIDPIENNIILSRFMSELRSDMPDIDIDLPHKYRDTIFDKIYEKWDGKVGRISNHIIYKPKSAIREAIRREGYHHMINRGDTIDEIFEDDPSKIRHAKNTAHKLVGTFNTYSLHCGGIIIFDSEVPKDYLLEDKPDAQLKLNKDDVKAKKLIKIDLLSNRGLSQLWDCSQMPLNEYPIWDEKVQELLSLGNIYGLTFGESRAMRKAFVSLQPKNLGDIALCLAIIRPASVVDGKRSSFYRDFRDEIFKGNAIVYDDDATIYIMNKVGCSESQAEVYRKGFAKGDQSIIREFKGKLKYFTVEEQKKIMDICGQQELYAFCKSHAYSYAKLVFCLAYQKIYNPIDFWISTLNNCHSYYRPWVHYREAQICGLELNLGRPPFRLNGNKVVSIYPVKLQRKNKEVVIRSKLDELRVYGYWIGYEFIEDMYVMVEEDYSVSFRGIIATSRYYRRNSDRPVTFTTIGYGNGKFIDLVINGIIATGKGVYGIEGNGKLEFHDNCEVINVEKCKSLYYS